MVISDDRKISDIFIEYFNTIVPKLRLAIPKDVIFATNGIEDPVLKAVHKNQRHPSILAIKEKYNGLSFSFSSVSLSNLQNKLKTLDSSQSVHETDILTKVLKENMDIFSPFLLNYFNNIIDSSSSPNHLKLANITPVHKKDSRNYKKYYRPVRVLSDISKVFENILNQQISAHLENIFSKQETGFRRGFLVMLEKFRKALDKGGDYAGLLTDPSKAFDCVHHDFIIAKLHAYGFDMPSLKLVNSHLTNRRQNE